MLELSKVSLYSLECGFAAHDVVIEGVGYGPTKLLADIVGEKLLNVHYRCVVFLLYEPHSRRSATPFYLGRTPTPAYAHSVLSDRG